MAGWLHHRTVRTCGVPAEAGERPSIGWSRDSSDHAIVWNKPAAAPYIRTMCSNFKLQATVPGTARHLCAV